MSLKMEIKITGIKELEKKINQITGATHREQKKAIEKGCALIVTDAKKICPVETGYLRANITHEVIETPDGGIVGKAGVNDVVGYAEAVEFGGFKGKQPRKPGKQMPFLFPSYQKNIRKINKLIADATVTGLEK